jgi:hypothetical protein
MPAGPMPLKRLSSAQSTTFTDLVQRFQLRHSPFVFHQGSRQPIRYANRARLLSCSVDSALESQHGAPALQTLAATCQSSLCWVRVHPSNVLPAMLVPLNVLMLVSETWHAFPICRTWRQRPSAVPAMMRLQATAMLMAAVLAIVSGAPCESDLSWGEGRTGDLASWET